MTGTRRGSGGRRWSRFPPVRALAIATVGGVLALAFLQGCRNSPIDDGSSTSSASVASGASSTVTPGGGANTSGDGPAGSRGPPDAVAPAAEDDLAVEIVVGDLEVPWEIRFFPDGDLLVTERGGRILRIDPAEGTPAVLGRVPAARRGEGGLLGAAVDPGFPQQPYIYVAYTYEDERAANGLSNRVSRLTVSGDAVGEEHVLVDGIPGASNHDGSRVAFGPDGYLWVTTGDASRSELAQDVRSLAGKVLRMDRDGRPAPGNPFGDSLVYSYGHRNPQGLAWLEGDPQPFVTEHGPSADDEVNHIEAGGNYGWPLHGGRGGGPEFVDPIYSWTPTIAPAGAVFYGSEAIPGWRGSLLVVTLKQSDLRRLTPTDGSFSAIAAEDVLFDGLFGRLRAIAVGPDGAVYVGTSNYDGRGDARAGDDKILRIAAK